jgi:hypothetical protein
MTPTGQSKLRIMGNLVLTSAGATTWPIAGCTQTGGPPTPCTLLSEITTGESIKLKVNGAPVLMDNLTGVTNGAPVGSVSAQANQSKLTAI